jgi:protein-tyrosine phosphatase
VETILILGAADTGRAPMTAAMLRRMLDERRVAALVESAGIIGHDGDGPTSDAVATMDQMGIDIADHIARSLSDELASQAAILIAVDAGVARVARARFPSAADRIVVLGELAGRTRDIPDPFKMQIGAWLTYASEIERMLRGALPRILTQIGAPGDPEPAPDATQGAAALHPAPEVAVELPPERIAAIGQIQRLLGIIEQMPEIVDWGAARSQLEALFDQCQATPYSTDLAPALVGSVRAALALTPALPSPGQLAALRELSVSLTRPIPHATLAAFALRLGGWQSL